MRHGQDVLVSTRNSEVWAYDVERGQAIKTRISKLAPHCGGPQSERFL